MIIDPYLIRYLEKSQRVKFKQVPTLHKHNKKFNLSIDEKDNKTGKRIAKIYLEMSLWKKGFEKARDLIILHEAREILISQNDRRTRKLTDKEQAIMHLQAIRHEAADKKFLNEYFKYYTANVYKGYGISFPDEVYNLEDYMKIREKSLKQLKK